MRDQGRETGVQLLELSEVMAVSGATYSSTSLDTWSLVPDTCFLVYTLQLFPDECYTEVSSGPGG